MQRMSCHPIHTPLYWRNHRYGDGDGDASGDGDGDASGDGDGDASGDASSQLLQLVKQSTASLLPHAASGRVPQ
jgi:hypothetical protein